MNYIKQLQSHKEQLISEKRDGLDALLELQVYLMSAKFWEDSTVQVGDVLDRMQPIKAALIGGMLIADKR